MRKLRSIFICITSIFFLSACTSSSGKEAAKETIDSSTEKSEKVEVSEPSDNDVYGQLVDENVREMVKDSVYQNEKDNLIYHVINNEITQIDKEFDSKLGIKKDLDEEFLTGHAFDYMEENSLLLEKKSENTYIYESSLLNKKYEVIFQADNDENIITRLIISQTE